MAYDNIFKWLIHTNEAIKDVTETLFENKGVVEKGIVFETDCGVIALTKSEIERILSDLTS